MTLIPVQCDGEQHQIIVEAGGRMQLRNHAPGYCRTVLPAKIAAGIELNGCERFVAQVRGEARGHVVNEYELACAQRAATFRSMREVRRQRQHAANRIMQRAPWPWPLLRERADRIIANAIKAAALTPGPPVVRTFISRKLTGALEPTSDRCLIAPFGDQSVLQVTIRPSWFDRVSRRGLVVRYGHLGLDVIDDENGDPKTLIATPLHGPGVGLSSSIQITQKCAS